MQGVAACPRTDFISKSSVELCNPRSVVGGHIKPSFRGVGKRDVCVNKRTRLVQVQSGARKHIISLHASSFGIRRWEDLQC